VRWIRCGKTTTLMFVAAVAAMSGGVTSAHAQLAVPRSNEKVLFLIPRPGENTDTSYVVSLAEEVRSRMRAQMRNRMIVIRDEVICEVLTQSAYSCDAVLGPADADRLARALQSDAYLVGTVWHENATPHATLHMIDIGRSGLSGWTSVRGMPGDPPRAFAKTIVDTLENQVRAAQYARECSDRMGNGDFQRARERAERAFRIYENHPGAAMCAEVVSEALREPPDSQIAYLERAVRGDSLLTRAWERLGRLHNQKGDSVQALAAFSQQSRIDETNRELRMGVIAGLITLREHQQAADLADDWLERNPLDMGMIQVKERACVEGGLWECALATLQTEYEMDSSLVGDTVFYQKVVGVAQAADHAESMLRWTTEAVTRAPDAVSLWRAHAGALAAAGMTDSSMTDSMVAVYRHVLTLDPTDFRSALRGAHALLDDLPIDTLTPLDTARLLAGGLFLGRATTASRDTSVLMDAAVLYFQKGSALVRSRQQFALSVEWLKRARDFDVLQRLTQQTNFFLGYGLMLRIYEFDPQVTETQSCELVQEEAQMIADGIQATQIGAPISPAAADQFLAAFRNFEQRIPTLRRAYECP
jgi:tetratricopeptide (TPR) repeat protein